MRQREVYPTKEVAHLWMHKAQLSARNQQGNLYYRDSTIYSYGSHFPIARHVTNGKGEDAVLFTTRSYSSTTAKHLRLVRCAVPDSVPMLMVTRPDASDMMKYSREKGELVTKLIARLKAINTPAPRYPALKKETIKLARVDTPVEVLAGRRLCIHPTYNNDGRKLEHWCVSHRASGLAVQKQLTRLQARDMLARLDRCRVWDELTVDESGRITADDAVRNKLWLLVERAHAHATKTAPDNINRNPGTIAKLYRELQAAVLDANEFNNFFGYTKQYAIPDELLSLGDVMRQHESGVQARRDARDAARSETWRKYELERQERARKLAEKMPELLEAWRAGSNPPELQSHYGVLYNLPVMLRLSRVEHLTIAEVETSKGARVPVEHALRGLRLVRRLVESGNSYQRNGHTIHLGHYAIDSITPDGTLTAGCHVIQYEEIQRFAPVLEQYAREHGVEGKLLEGE